MDKQRTWDECLIAAWRADGAVVQAITNWERATGLSFVEHQPELRRAPRLGYPWKFRVRVFVASFLDKINTRLWDQPPQRDAALIDKLQTSTYTTQTSSTPDESLRDLKREANRLRNNRATMVLNMHNYGERNHDTNWGVTKASKRRIGGRR